MRGANDYKFSVHPPPVLFSFSTKKFINYKFAELLLYYARWKRIRKNKLWIGEEKVQRMQAINAFKLLPSMLFYHCIFGCRSKKEQQKREEECVSGIKRDVCACTF